ncbi:MAG TPA: pitrilysin family protein [Verrucomicrobiae bacterium]
MYQVTRFPNGLTVATAEMPHMASVSLGVWVAVGGRFEPAALNGASHFIEHMLFKGTRKRPARKISEDVEGVGGYLNAFTGEENTCFYSKALADRFDDLLEVLMDMFLHSTFAPAEVDKERGVIKEEVAMYFDQPAQLVQELLNQTLWPEQPLGRPITGTSATLDFLNRARLVEFMRTRYLAGNTVIAAAGNLRHQQVVKAVAGYARHVPDGRPPAYAPARDGQDAPRVNLRTKRTEQTQLALGIRTCSRHDDRRFALRILNALLGENMSSRLFQLVREDHALAYSIYSSPSFFDDTGDLVISAGLDDENLPRALKLIISELRRLREKVPGAAELRRARDYVIGQLDLNLEGTEPQMNWVGEHFLGYGRIPSAAETKRRLASVTAGELRGIARDFFRPERMNLALVTPLKRVPGLARILETLSA